MILHCVHLRLREDADEKKLAAVMEGLARLVDRLDGMTKFRHGENLDFERKSAEYPYGFVAEFVDTKSVQIYADDPEHKALGAQLVEMSIGGADGIMVYDLQVPL